MRDAKVFVEHAAGVNEKVVEMLAVAGQGRGHRVVSFQDTVKEMIERSVADKQLPDPRAVGGSVARPKVRSECNLLCSGYVS